jgi:1,2-diacylglycerol 3-beta-galactosyltransferase
VHGWWDTRVDKFVVNNEYAYHQAFKRGFKENQVKQVPFITRKSVLDTTESKEFYRKKYDIPKNDFVVKLADGIYGEAKMKSYIYELIKIEKPLSIIAIAGKNEALYNELIQLKDSLPSHIHLFPFPFVKEINELIKASDVFITKAGPNAVLDSVYLNVPVIINYYANVIEKTTKRVFIDKYNCGLYIPNKKECKSYIEKCIDNPNILDEFIQNTQQFDKTKNGAPEIAKIILNEIK